MGTMALAGALLVTVAPAAAADSTRDDQWALKAFQAEKVWKESTGEGVTVAVIDDGVDVTHPDLRDNVLEGKDIGNGGPGTKGAKDHGTAMASLIAGHGHGPGNDDGVKGLAPKAKILPIKADHPQDGKFANLGESIRYAVDQGASVINLSLSGFAESEGEEEAISHAWENNVVVVAGSGNDGGRGIGYPARSPGVVSVGAITEAGNVWKDSNFGKGLTLTAPGTDVMAAAVTKPYDAGDGTSNATAYVSAAAALVRAKFPDLTAGQVVNRLAKTALLPDATSEAPDDRYGYGMIRPYRALTEDIPAGPKNGPLTPAKGAGEPGSKNTGGAGDDQQKAADEIRNGSDDSAGSRQNWPLIGLGVMGTLVVVGLVIALVLRGRRGSGPPGSGGAPGAPFPPGGQAPYQAPPHAPANYPQGPAGPPPGPPPGGPGGY